MVKTGLEKGMRAGLEAEAEAFGELVVSPQAASLMSIDITISSGPGQPSGEAAVSRGAAVARAAIDNGSNGTSTGDRRTAPAHRQAGRRTRT